MFRVHTVGKRDIRMDLKRHQFGFQTVISNSEAQWVIAIFAAGGSANRYENTPIQIHILRSLPPKNENVQMKNSGSFHISALNIDCGYLLEPPRIYVFEQK